MAVLSYIGPLVFIPIFAAKNSGYARFHANQGLVLLLLEAAWSIIHAIIDELCAPHFFSALWASVLNIVNLAFIALMIFGIVNAASGCAKRLPVIGSIILIK